MEFLDLVVRSKVESESELDVSGGEFTAYFNQLDSGSAKHPINYFESNKSWQGPARILLGTPGPDFRVSWLGSVQPDKVFQTGRAMVCRCRCGDQSFVSATVRLERKTGVTERTSLVDPISVGWLQPAENGYAIDPTRDTSGALSSIAEQLFELLTHDRSPRGLVVYTGATKSNKSVLLRDFVLRHLQASAASRGETPHLLTLEDPIESPLSRKSPAVLLQDTISVNYTARSIGPDGDVGSLAEGLRDALRQTPAVVFAGELRGRRDWLEALEFAGTGHLIVATAHAGSLVEAMTRILIVKRAETPAARGEVADRLCAVVHLRHTGAINKGDGSTHPGVILPAVWLRTLASTSGLVADGAASILPFHGPAALRRGSFGRQHFAHLVPEVSEQLQHRARQMDLAGVD